MHQDRQAHGQEGGCDNRSGASEMRVLDDHREDDRCEPARAEPADERHRRTRAWVPHSQMATGSIRTIVKLSTA